MRVMLIGLLPFVLVQVYSSTLRETGQTIVPMVSGIAAVLVNLSLNYVLIFGRFGFEAMGVRGAATATVISRFVELAIIMVWTHLHSGAENRISHHRWNLAQCQQQKSGRKIIWNTDQKAAYQIRGPQLLP